MAYRWTRHRVRDAASNDKTGLAALSLWWVARAAAEETLQGAPLASAWLRLFRNQISPSDRYWLRWQGDLAESAELRRAYSGLYGRFFARALLGHHLGLRRFNSLKRNGLSIPGSAEVRRTLPGDIPDWIAWDDRNSKFVLAEAKGSLSCSDFFASTGPKCVIAGKQQFGRVETLDNGNVIHPDQWVAATRWATDLRVWEPVTVLWDPPVQSDQFSPEDARRHRKGITRAWLDSIAPAMGWDSADDLISPERARQALRVSAAPGAIPETEDWPVGDEEELPADVMSQFAVPTTGARSGDNVNRRTRLTLEDNLLQSPLYDDREFLNPTATEKAPYEGSYVAAVITRFGVRPVRSKDDLDDLLRIQERARKLEEPAMLVGIPLDFDPAEKTSRSTWVDGAGIASDGDLGLFDLRRTTVEFLDHHPTRGRLT